MLKLGQQELDETWDVIANHALIMCREGLVTSEKG